MDAGRGGRGVTAGRARPHPTRTLLVVGMATVTYSIAQTTILPALPAISRHFHAGTASVAWTLTGFLVLASVATPIVGRLGDMFGKRRTLVGSLYVFSAGALLCALATSLPLLVAGRVLMGVAGGIFPLAFGVVRDELPRERLAGGIGLVSAIGGVGGGLGFVVAGPLVDSLSFRATFWLSVGMGIGTAVATQLLVPESPTRQRARLDLRGAVVFAVGLVLPLVAISQANRVGWGDVRTLGLLAAGLVVLAAWVPLQRRTASPLADVALLARPAVLTTNLATLLMGFGVFAAFLLVPQLAGTPHASGYGFGLDATKVGLVLIPSPLAGLVAGPLAGLLVNRFSAKLPFALGALLCSAGLLVLGLDHGSVTALVLLNALIGLGFGLAFAAMPNLIVAAVPAAQTGEATGFNALVRTVGMSIGSQVAAAILASTAVAGGYATDHGFVVAFVVGSAVALLAGLVVLRVPEPNPRRLRPVEQPS